MIASGALLTVSLFLAVLVGLFAGLALGRAYWLDSMQDGE